jgi:hypothetical protein
MAQGKPSSGGFVTLQVLEVGGPLLLLLLLLLLLFPGLEPQATVVMSNNVAAASTTVVSRWCMISPLGGIFVARLRQAFT